MGCGHSKINIYPRKHRGKSNSKKSVNSEIADSEEEEGIETEADNSENIEDCDRKTIKVKPFGGPLLAQAEISTSQQDFFKMLDEKIQNGPDYNSESESEMQAEAVRLRSLMKDWETASQGSRSLPSTPRRRPPVPKEPPPLAIPPDAQVGMISQSIIHQSYGVTSAQVASSTVYRQYPNMQMAQSYQAMYGTPAPPMRPMSGYDQRGQPLAVTYSARPMEPPGRPMEISNRPLTGYEQRTTPLRTYSAGSPPKRPQDGVVMVAGYSPTHRMYGGTVGTPMAATVIDRNNCEVVYKPVYANGDLIQQQQIYNQPVQYQPYLIPREQVLAQQAYRGPVQKHQYQNAPTLPMAVKNPQNDMNSMNRKLYELT